MLLSLCLMARSPARATEWSLALRTGPWTLEQFGDDVAVLRNGSAGASRDDVGLLVGCAGRDRSIRLTFPGAFTGAAGREEEGAALIVSATPSRPRLGVVTHFKIVEGNTLVVTTASSAFLNRLTDLLAGSGHALDLVVSWGPGPIVLTRLDVLHIVHEGKAPDRDLIAHFLDACRHSGPSQAR